MRSDQDVSVCPSCRTKVEDAYALVKRLCEVTTTADRKEQRKPAGERAGPSFSWQH